MTQKLKHKLNPKQELFCQLYASGREFFGNGVESYIEAFGVDKSKSNWYKTAKAGASRLLTNVNLLARIDDLLDIYVNDQVADKELGFVILQKVDLSSKVAAIREYNKLKKRTSELNLIDSTKIIAIQVIVNGTENPTQIRAETIRSISSPDESGN
jgi:hypothetical protein